MPPLPSPVRVALGLVATLMDEARSLPDKAIELPMLAISRALQLSLRAQQRYTTLASRGDELLAGRQTTDEPPPWATFDPPAEAAPIDDPAAEAAPVESTPAESAPVESAPVQSAPVQSAPVQSAPVQSAPVESAPVDDGRAKSRKTAAKAPKPRPSRARKTVRAPRTGTPSAFDAVGDSEGDTE